MHVSIKDTAANRQMVNISVDTGIRCEVNCSFTCGRSIGAHRSAFDRLVSEGHLKVVIDVQSAGQSNGQVKDTLMVRSKWSGKF